MPPLPPFTSYHDCCRCRHLVAIDHRRRCVEPDFCSFPTDCNQFTASPGTVRWLQLRFDFDSTAKWSHYDHSTSYVTTRVLRYGLTKQEAQLMLTNPCDAFRSQSRSPNIVPFHMLIIVSSCATVTLSLRLAVFPIFDYKKFVILNPGQRSFKVIESGTIR